MTTKVKVNTETKALTLMAKIAAKGEDMEAASLIHTTISPLAWVAVAEWVNLADKDSVVTIKAVETTAVEDKECRINPQETTKVKVVWGDKVWTPRNPAAMAKMTSEYFLKEQYTSLQ
jgi:hypothetical protein